METPRVIAVIGSLNTDLVTLTPRVPSGGETLTATSFSTGAGGKGANQAVACARLSRKNPKDRSADDRSLVQVRMRGAVGADEFGPALIDSLQADEIDTSGVTVLENHSTGVAVILVESNSGENRILLSPGANHSLRPMDFVDVSSLGNPRPDLVVLQLEIPLDTVLRILQLCKEARIPALLNPAPAVELPTEIYKDLDHLIMNESEAAILSGRAIEDIVAADSDLQSLADDFLKKGVRNVVITLGSKGAFFSNEIGKGSFVPAEQGIKVVDTTAAGDTFVGCYSVSVVSREKSTWDMAAAVTLSCKAAARTIEKKGAQTAIPWMNEVPSRHIADE